MEAPKKQIDWNDPRAVEAALAEGGCGDIDNEIATDRTFKHTGVGRAAMTAAGTEQDKADFDQDMEEPGFSPDTVL